MELDSQQCFKRLCELAPSTLSSSAGYYHALKDDLPGLATKAKDYGFQGLELSGDWGLDDLSSCADFDYLSVHAPNVLDEEAVAALAALPATVTTIVVHAEHLRGRLDLLAPLGQRLAIENLEHAKRYGSSASDLDEIFSALPQARLCLDVARGDWQDPSQRTTHQLLDRFSERLAQIHLSVLSSSAWHLPLTATAIDRLRPVLERVRRVPWILEAPFADGPCDKCSCERCGHERLS